MADSGRAGSFWAVLQDATSYQLGNLAPRATAGLLLWVFVSVIGLLIKTSGLCRTFTSPKALTLVKLSSQEIGKHGGVSPDPTLGLFSNDFVQTHSQPSPGLESEFIMSQLTFHQGKK